MAEVLTSENLQDFYNQKLGLDETPAAIIDDVIEPVEPEPKQEETIEEPKTKVKMRFDKVTQERDQAKQEAERERQRATELEAKLKALETQAVPKEQSRDEKPKPDQFVDAFEYAEALADWSAEQAVARSKQEEADLRKKVEEAKRVASFNQRIEAVKAELPDFDDMIASAEVMVSDQVRDAILESDVGPRIMYHLAENPEIAEKIANASVITALREIGKLEARFEKTEPKEVKPVVVKSKAPEPIKPLKTGSSEQVVITDTDKMTFAQYKEMRKAKRIR